MPWSHLIIDGFNIIHAYKELKMHLLAGHIDLACERLIGIAQAIHDNQPNLRTTVVFDGNGTSVDVQHPIPHLKTFSVIFSPKDASADDVIRKIAFNSKQPSSVIVATQDSILAHSLVQLKIQSLCSEDFMALHQRSIQNQTFEINTLQRQTKTNKNKPFEAFFQKD